jgi:hypothetical protein
MFIRQSAFDGNRRMLKGGLHCHTTRSDGDGSPEEVIRLHRANGYDFLALTDHRIYNYQNFAPETGITIIPAMEFDDNFEQNENGRRCFHTVCLGPDDASNGYRQDERVDSGTAKDQEGYQKYLDRIHAKNNLTTYCHPDWSCTPARYFEKLRGNFAMELWNTGDVDENEMDIDNGTLWDELLGEGNRIFGIAADDGHRMTQHCRGWVMVNAENNVKDILRALSAGAFYASCGPVIRDFTVEDGIARVVTDPCSLIRFHAAAHPTRIKVGENLTEASLDLRGKSYPYIRVSVKDAQGRCAWSNPIFLK